MNSEENNKPSVPSSVYTQEYFENCCQGHEDFNESLGTRLPKRLAFPLKLANLKPEIKIVDVGCGRGEVLLHCARQGAKVWGFDYALPALQIAQKTLENVASQEELRAIFLSQSNARHLPFATNSIEVVFMLDVVEHLYPYELEEAFTEIFRIMQPGGRLVIHTMPNLWYYHLGYPIYRFVQSLRGEKLPKDPRDRWDFRHVHVNEQTPSGLSSTLRKCGFKARVWLQTTQDYSYETSRVVRWGMSFLTKVYPFRWIFCNDIFAIGIKR